MSLWFLAFDFQIKSFVLRYLRCAKCMHAYNIHIYLYTLRVYTLLYIYIYIYIYICVCVCVCIYIYIYIHRKDEVGKTDMQSHGTS